MGIREFLKLLFLCPLFFGAFFFYLVYGQVKTCKLVLYSFNKSPLQNNSPSLILLIDTIENYPLISGLDSTGC